MATSDRNGSESSVGILVRGIPSTTKADKLTMHFQRRKTGGGYVRSVTFPISVREPDTAIVIFEDSRTVQTVLRNNHKIGGKTVKITALQPRPKVFESINAEISKRVVEKITSLSKDIDEVFEDVVDATGCSIDQKRQTYVVKGEWYQIQAAFDMLDVIVSDSLEEESVSTLTPIPITSSTRNVVSTIIDKDQYSYMEKVHKSDIDKIKQQFKVDFKMTKTVAAKIEATSITSLQDSQKAVEEIEELKRSVQRQATQEVVECDGNIPQSAVDNIFDALLPKFPQTHMGRLDDSSNRVIIIAATKEKCRKATDMFKHYLSLVKLPATKDANSNAAGGENTIDVDKDILQFVQRVDGDTLQRIWETCGAKVNVSTIGDCARIEVVSRGSTMPFRPQDAIDQFQKICSHANDKAVQEMFDLETLKEPVSGEGISEAIRVTSNAHKRVHLSQMVEEKSKVLFIANSKAECNAAMGLFHKLVGGGN